MAKKILRALLVGVTEYNDPPKRKPALVDQYFSKDLPSAALDVAEMLELVDKLARSYRDVEVLPLVEGRDTTKEAIRLGLKWLFESAGPEHQLLFYFSGHGRLVVDRSCNFLDEVLLPSDYEWTIESRRFLTDEEMMQDAEPALRKGACLEVILEACSATHQLEYEVKSFNRRPFGCFFGGDTFPAGSGAVWGACLRDQNSHSGHVPYPCPPPRPSRRNVEAGVEPASPVQGLFTYYFCRNFFAGRSLRTPLSLKVNTRGEILKRVTTLLKAYRKAYNKCCRESRPLMEAQIPSLYTALGLSIAGTMQAEGLGKPLSGDCIIPGTGKPFTKPSKPCPDPASPNSRNSPNISPQAGV